MVAPHRDRAKVAVLRGRCLFVVLPRARRLAEINKLSDRIGVPCATTTPALQHKRMGEWTNKRMNTSSKQ